MAEKDKRYYWLKLQKDFFKRNDIRIIENMPNGKDYILFYLKLLCEGIEQEGNLRFNEQIPYNEEMLATVTNTNIDIVRSAVTLFTSLKMMEQMDDGTLYMIEVNKLMGSETYWAAKKREHRVGQCPTTSNEIPTCPSKRLDKEIDTDIEIEKEINISSSSADEEDLSTAMPIMPIVESYGVPVLQSDYAAFQRMTNQYMQQYWETTANDNDYRNVFELTRKRIVLPNGEAVAVVDTDKQALLERALYISSEKGRQGMNWGFVQGILRRWDQLDLTTIEQIEEHEYHRKNKTLTKGRC